MLEVTVLHEYGACSHFAGLRHLETRGIVHLDWAEFNLPVQLGRIFLRRPKSDPSRLIHNVRMIRGLLTAAPRIVVVGAAPYDPAILYAQALKKRHRIIYFTSWAFWDGPEHVKSPVLPGIRQAWADFLKGTVTVCVTRRAAESIKTRGALPYHIPHAIDTDLMHPPETRSLSPGKPRILYVGQLAERKGIDMLITLISSHALDAEWWFVGDGPYRDRVQKLHGRGLLRYFGCIRDKRQLSDLYRECDALVLPSESEPFGIVLIEAMASGLPVVATDCVGPREIIRNGKSGLIVPRGDLPSLQDALGLLVREPGLRGRMGLEARRVCLESYSVRSAGLKWEAVLKAGGAIAP